MLQFVGGQRESLFTFVSFVRVGIITCTYILNKDNSVKINNKLNECVRCKLVSKIK